MSSDLQQQGTPGKTQDNASLLQYESQLERAKTQSFAILYDDMHLNADDTKRKFQLAINAGVPLGNVGWFVLDKGLPEDDEVLLLDKRQKEVLLRPPLQPPGGGGGSC